MEVLVSGLHSYLGRASVSYLPDDGYHVYGLSRDTRLLSYKTNIPITANITNVDLIRRGKAYEDFRLDTLDLSFYFTQIPDLDDTIAIRYELLCLRHFILLSQRNGCNRIIYVGRMYDKYCLEGIKALFVELQVAYTIVLKDIAIGTDTAFGRFLTKISANRYVFLFRPTERCTFCPFVLEDIFRWIKQIPWKEAFVNEEIEFGGAQLWELKDMLVEQAKYLKINNMKRIFSVPN